jgi:predicted Na+-dependent transporter
MLRRGLERAGDRLLLLAGVATVLALLVPSHALARRSDLILAALVLFTALGIAPAQLASLTAHKRVLAVLVAAPFVALVPLAWLISRLFSGAVRDGVLALGVSSTEIAAVGLVALAGGSAVLALGALAGSLVVAALLGPVLLGLMAGGATDSAVGALVVRFALVVLVPLAVGLAARAALPRLEHAGRELAGLATLAVVLLVYAAMSGAGEGGDLLPAAAAGALFLAGSAIPALAWAALSAAALRATGALVIELRDFAVAAALAGQAFGPAAATVSGVYGVLMLLLGAAAAHLLPRPAARPDRVPSAAR